MGSTNVRVGSTIFGSRNAPQSKATQEEAAEQAKGHKQDTNTQEAVKSQTDQMKNLAIH